MNGNGKVSVSGWKVMGLAPRVLYMVWNCHRGYTVALALLTVVLAVIPTGQIWARKLISDGVVELFR